MMLSEQKWITKTNKRTNQNNNLRNDLGNGIIMLIVIYGKWLKGIKKWRRRSVHILNGPLEKWQIWRKKQIWRAFARGLGKIQMICQKSPLVKCLNSAKMANLTNMISLAKNRHRGLVKTQNSKKMSKGVFWKVALLTNMASIAKMANSAKICKRFSETSNVKS